MSAYSVDSIEEVAQRLCACEGVPCVCVPHRTCDDVAPALAAAARHIAAAGRTVRVVCADDVAARRFRALLADAPAGCSVASVREVALEALALPAVQGAVGRGPRVLDDNEHDVLMEDVKVSGLKPGRLREMLKFFYKSVSDCADDDPAWLISTEEKNVHAILTENLEARRAVLPCEASALAYRGLTAAHVAPGPCTVIAADYPAMSAASQRLVRHLATEGLVAAGGTLAVPCAQEAYPCFEGFAALRAACDCEVALAPRGAGEIAADVRSYALAQPRDEFAFVAGAVRERLAAGTAPEDVLVAVPNATWAAQMVRALAEEGVAAAIDEGPRKAKGDPRTEGRFARQKLVAFSRLWEDPDDFTALRSWMGFGDWLLRSDAFLELLAYAREHGMAPADAVSQLRALPEADRPTVLFGKFDGPLDALDGLRRACEGASRDAAAALLAAHGMPLSADEEALLGDDPAHADFDGLARGVLAQAAGQAGCGAAAGCVTVAPYGRCHGRHVRSVFATGLVNGFLPALDAVEDSFTVDHRRVALERERLRFLDVLATARDEAVCTRFSCDRLENTAALRMQATRVTVRDGVRMAQVAPSAFFALTPDVLAPGGGAARQLETKVRFASSTL